jgi:DNA-binding transcriptional LysR family regulator
MTDAGEMFFVPPLIARIRAIAPRVRLVIHQLPRQTYKEALENGEADLAVGQLPHGQTDLMQQVLLIETFEGYAKIGHPILQNPTIEAFLAADHLIVGRPAVTELHIHKALGVFAARRKVSLELGHYLPAAFVLAQTDLIALLPRTVSDFIASFGTLGRFRPPLEIEPITMRQFWHARSTNDEGCKWLRSQVAALFQRHLRIRQSDR